MEILKNCQNYFPCADYKNKGKKFLCDTSAIIITYFVGSSAMLLPREYDYGFAGVRN